MGCARALLVLCAGMLVVGCAAPRQGATIWLDDMDVDAIEQEWGKPQARRTVNGGPISLAGQDYARGVGTHALSEIYIELDGGAERFTGLAGVVDDTSDVGTVRVSAWVDGQQRAQSDVLRRGHEPFAVDVDLRGARLLRLVIDDAGDSNHSDHAAWAEARLTLAPGAKTLPRILPLIDDPPPIAMGDGPEPAIHGPRVVGTTPGRPFLFRIPATGEGPLRFATEGLPAGLALDPQKGLIEGRVLGAGEYPVTLVVSGPRGEARRRLTIVAGHRKLALTPPMGWNSWNVWACTVDESMVRAAAEAMAASGLADKGYQYIVIDDCWSGGRDEQGRIVPNEKFADMQALAGDIHALGLKFGIYSSPGPTTCQEFMASHGHEALDAQTWADWGVDFLKYDWCSQGRLTPWNAPVEELQAPYRVMREALDNVDRDIVYSLCQYGLGEVWKWGTEVGGNMWRMGGDIYDSWTTVAQMGYALDGREQYAGPGHWNDPDMLVLGMLGWGHPTRPTNLNRTEQIAHMTLWSLLAAPLMIGCDMQQLDDFTLAVLGNTEVIDVNQDPLGRPARRILHDEQANTQVWARPLADGTLAVGLFNGGYFHAEVAAPWDALDMGGPQPVRDLWQRKELGIADGEYRAVVPPHGALLLKVGRARQENGWKQRSGPDSD